MDFLGATDALDGHGDEKLNVTFASQPTVKPTPKYPVKLLNKNL